MSLRPYDAFETKAAAKRAANRLRTSKKYPVQFVRIKKAPGRLKYMIYIGGKNSTIW